MKAGCILWGVMVGWVCLLSFPADAQKRLGVKFDFVCQDTVFKDPYVDMDEWRDSPVRHRYVHGGFSDGTRFSFYFPEKENYSGRFFQYITPFPDSEVSAQAATGSDSMIGFSLANGAYFVETNEGGAIDFSNPTKSDPTIGAYRANAACAEFSRYLAQRIYKCDRPYGYCFGGSGGAYRTVGGMESTSGVWDGACPYVLGSPQAIPNVFAVRMHALRVLKDKMPQIVDALMPGGSGNPYEGLTVEQCQVLQEATRMGFPIKAWYGWETMSVHGFLVLYKSVVASDRSYFEEDFWNKPGYQGYEAPESLKKARVQQKAVITEIYDQDEGERLRLVEPLAPGERGSADQAWKSIGSEIKEKPVGYKLNVNLRDIGMGGDLIILSGKANGQVLQITKTDGQAVGLAPTNPLSLLGQVAVGDSVQVDNSDFLAVQTYYRHQVPTEDYYVWNQFRGYNGVPIYPQRPRLLGPMFTSSAAGCLPTGKINGKLIILCSVWDREAFAWQGDWYKKKVEEHLGEKADENVRLWYTDRATHGEVDDPTEVVSYAPVLQQALLDVSAWVEKGIAPSRTSMYKVEEGQVILDPNGLKRGGIQPVPNATINGEKRAEVKPGEEVTIHVVVEVPEGQGRVIKAEWCLDGSKEYTIEQDLSQAIYSADGSRVEFDTAVRYDTSGTYFPTVLVYSERDGNAENIYANVRNLDKVRVVVK